MSIINWDAVVTRYTVLGDYDSTSVQQTTRIEFAEGELNRRLSNCYTVPFSSNNITAKDLVIDISFANTIKYRDNEKYKTIMDQIDAVTTKLCENNASMIADDGSLIEPIGTANSNKAYSTTQDYSPTFDMQDQVDQQIDPDQLEAEADANN